MRSALSWLVAAGVLVRLGASLECCSEGASFWDDLEDPARTPAGAGSHAESKLPRLCPAMLGAAGSSFARCAGGALSSLHLLEHVSAARSWQRLLDIKPAMRTSQHFLNHSRRGRRCSSSPPRGSASSTARRRDGKATPCRSQSRLRSLTNPRCRSARAADCHV